MLMLAQQMYLTINLIIQFLVDQETLELEAQTALANALFAGKVAAINPNPTVNGLVNIAYLLKLVEK